MICPSATEILDDTKRLKLGRVPEVGFHGGGLNDLAPSYCPEVIALVQFMPESDVSSISSSLFGALLDSC